MLLRIAPIFLVSVFLLLFLPGDSAAKKKRPAKTLLLCRGLGVTSTSKPPEIGSNDVKLETISEEILREDIARSIGSDLSVEPSTSTPRRSSSSSRRATPSSAKGSSSRRATPSSAKKSSTRRSNSSSGKRSSSRRPNSSSAKRSSSRRSSSRGPAKRSARRSSLSSGSGINKQTTTVVLMHGFTSSAEKMKAKGFEDAYKGKGVNLILVDWSKLAAPGVGLDGGYKRAAACAIEVGKYLAKELAKQRYDPSELHLIGHSLGAHGVGMAGREFAKVTGRKVAYVTGMDPAGPGFADGTITINVGLKGKLSISSSPELQAHKIGKDSGEFVAIVHSNNGAYGYAGRLGHVDYYVNGGGPIQEQCQKVKNVGLDRASHGYAMNVVVASIKGNIEQRVQTCEIALEHNRDSRCVKKRISELSIGGRSDVSRNSRTTEMFESGNSHGGKIHHGTYEIITKIDC